MTAGEPSSHPRISPLESFVVFILDLFDFVSFGDPEEGETRIPSPNIASHVNEGNDEQDEGDDEASVHCHQLSRVTSRVDEESRTKATSKFLSIVNRNACWKMVNNKIISIIFVVSFNDRNCDKFCHFTHWTYPLKF